MEQKPQPSAAVFHPFPLPGAGMADFQVLPPGLSSVHHNGEPVDPDLFQNTGRSLASFSLCFMDSRVGLAGVKDYVAGPNAFFRLPSHLQCNTKAALNS